jgi:hypothetical protein
MTDGGNVTRADAPSTPKKRVSYDSLGMATRTRAAKFALTRRRSSLQVYKTFLRDFHESTVGGWLIIFLGFLSAGGVGCLVGVVPQVATQLYAEGIFAEESGDGGPPPPQCSSSGPHAACLRGAAYARAAAAYSVLARNILALLINSVAGSYSDTHGRRGERNHGSTSPAYSIGPPKEWQNPCVSSYCCCYCCCCFFFRSSLLARVGLFDVNLVALQNHEQGFKYFPCP